MSFSDCLRVWSPARCWTPWPAAGRIFWTEEPMYKSWYWILLLAALAFLAPWASRQPDAVQRLLGLPGGSSSVSKAAFGILSTLVVVLVLMQIMRGRRR